MISLVKIWVVRGFRFWEFSFKIEDNEGVLFIEKFKLVDYEY